MQFLEVRLTRCRGRSTCKTDSEIDKFIDTNGHVLVISNQIDYQRENYSNDVLEKYSDFDIYQIQSSSRLYRMYMYQKNYIESEERYLGDGFFPRQLEYFQLTEG